MSEDRNWSFVNCLAYSYIVFATVDGDFADEEAGQIFNCIKEYDPDANDDEIAEACATAGRWALEDAEAEIILDRAEAIAVWLNENPFAGNDQGKKAFLDDLVRISMADGHFHENEKALIGLYAQTFGLDGYSV